MRVALGVEYSGWKYAGFQRQKHLNAVQNELERALSIIADAPVELKCAGRTDAGVSATGQVVHFDVEKFRPERAWQLGTNTHLPDDIVVTWAKHVPDDFHARFCATTASLCGIEKAGFEQDAAAMEQAVRFDLTLHAMMLIQTGIPMLYSGDEIAQVNDYSYLDDPNKAGDSRYIHRGKFRWDIAENIHDLSTPEGQVFCGLNALNALRKTNPAFSTAADVWTLDTGDDGLLAVGRYAGGQKIIGVFNFTGEEKTVTFPFDGGVFHDLMTDEAHTLEGLTVPAYGFSYMEQVI